MTWDRVRNGWKFVACAAALLGSAEPAAAQACIGCAAGCVTVSPGYFFCRAVQTPAGAGCVAWGLCGFGGGGDDPIGGIKRPMPRPSAVIESPRLEAYTLMFATQDASPLFPDGARATVVRGVGTPLTPSALLAAMERDHPGRVRGLRLIEGAVLVGGGDFRGAFAADDGRGYALDLRPDGGHTRLAVCEVVNEQRSGHLATASAAVGDVLLVRLALDGRDVVLAVSPAASDASRSNAAGTADPRSPHAEFVRQAGARTLAGRDLAIPMHLVETDPGECR